MSTSETAGKLVTTMAELPQHVGDELGPTDWRPMDQDRVNQFADATDDHQFIHVDVERAKASPFGGTIAHGYLTLALLAPITMELLQVTDTVAGINYGLDKVRFPAPLPVGSEWRGRGQIVSVDDVPGGRQVKFRATVEVKGQEKPAMVAEALVRLFG